MLRANDLIWSFVVNNYLLGKSPFPFDLLYWNADSTRMPAAMHSFYLRKMYQENLLAKPGGITLDGVPIDLRKIKTPAFLLSTREDHIAPWRSTYAATQLYPGRSSSCCRPPGHIAGVVNPPGSKYGHWRERQQCRRPRKHGSPARRRHPDSWWPTWEKWIAQYSGGEVPARQPGDGKLTPIEDAPGSYVQVRGEDSGHFPPGSDPPNQSRSDFRGAQVFFGERIGVTFQAGFWPSFEFKRLLDCRGEFDKLERFLDH